MQLVLTKAEVVELVRRHATLPYSMQVADLFMDVSNDEAFVVIELQERERT